MRETLSATRFTRARSTRPVSTRAGGWRYSIHAAKRVQQRGIPVFVVELLVRFGDRQADKHGARQLYFGKTAKRRLRGYLGREILSQLREHLNVYAVIADDEIITCGYRTRRIRRH